MRSLLSSVPDDGGHDGDDRAVRSLEDERRRGESKSWRRPIEAEDSLPNEGDDG
jgi:hypothetical protein